MAQITLNSSGVASNGSLVLQSNGTTTAATFDTSQKLTLPNDAVVNGLTVGRGAGAISTNTAVGASALAANTTGASNSAYGYQALKSVTTNADNSAFGTNAMRDTSTGGSNSAFGSAALIQNTTGSNNVAVGQTALFSNTTASNNTAVGYQAGYTNATGAGNTFVGDSSGRDTTGGYNTFCGSSSGILLSSGTKNTIIGRFSGNAGGLDIRTASNCIVLSDGDGNPRYYYNSGHYVTGINSGAGTYAVKWSSATGQITYDTSSARYKDNIRDSVYGLDAVMQIRSAQFEYKDDGRQDVGLIAEEVYEVIPELVALDADGNPNAVSYDRFVSVCIKAIQELNAQQAALKAEFDAYKEAHP